MHFPLLYSSMWILHSIQSVVKSWSRDVHGKVRDGPSRKKSLAALRCDYWLLTASTDRSHVDSQPLLAELSVHPLAAMCLVLVIAQVTPFRASILLWNSLSSSLHPSDSDVFVPCHPWVKIFLCHPFPYLSLSSLSFCFLIAALVLSILAPPSNRCILHLLLFL